MTTPRKADRPDSRSEAREQALELLYEATTKNVEPRQIVEGLVVPVDAPVVELVEGVSARLSMIDQLIQKYSKDWTIARMPSLDVIVLRLAIFELIVRVDVPVAVVIDEAVELAKKFSTDDSGRFVNGVLSSIAKEVRTQ